ncbi:hypothetical protein [uncultured Desulfobacter sp.]|uniref:hypothetical protein n=1 Tax=uncultured Desulfobacter sp. TaxID=240139 RepID=UPI002AAB6855|nr:hypothetical protein [uncultured Desulfobacter sp.]
MDRFWKNKKIIAFVALTHHTRFIVPVMEKLSALGADTRYVVAQAERSQEITAVECGLNYVHIFDYLSLEDNKDIHDNYLRARRVFSQALCSDPALATQVVTVTDKTLYATAQEYIGFKNMIRVEKPDICLALHELNRWGKTLAFWAKKFNVPFISLQEGLGYNQDFGYTGHVQYSTLSLVWGERIKKKFSDYEAPVERIIPVGNTHISREKEYQEKNNIRGKMRETLRLKGKTVPLLIFTSHPPELNKIECLLETVAKQSHLKMIIKFHPACKYPVYEAWTGAIPKSWHKSLIFVHGSYSVYDLMSASDLCVLAAPSTTGIEAIALGVPLVQLAGLTRIDSHYSFSRQGVALEMNPAQLARALADKMDFKGKICTESIDLFFKNELTQTTGATERIIEIMGEIIKANAPEPITPLPRGLAPSYEWSLIIPVPADSSNEFLFQLEHVTRHSEGQGRYEVILIEPETISPEINTVLASLSGDVIRLKTDPGQNTWACINDKAPGVMTGKKIAVLTELACPLANWLAELNRAFSTHGPDKIFGGKVINSHGSIVHAGMVLNANNAPVSAYLHLGADFAPANREQSFPMVDHMVCLSADLFLKLGGFSPRAGIYALMDLCLKARCRTNNNTACIFLPGLKILKNYSNQSPPAKDAIFFFARWHAILWDNEDSLYQSQGISHQQLDAVRMARAQQTAP